MRDADFVGVEGVCVWPFNRKPLLDSEMTDWMFEQADWLLRAHRHRAAFAAAQFLPLSEKVFPCDGAQGHDLALRLFAHVLLYGRVSWLNIELTPRGDSGRYEQVGQPIAVQPKSGPAGTYRHGDGVSEISYDTTLLRAPADLIAVLAHEVAHAILGFGASRTPPGDPAFEEMRTDFTAIFLGFGLYLAQFRADGRVASPEAAHEWKKLYMYYMNLREICFATALFSAVREVDAGLVLRRAPGAATPHLKRAFADLAREADRIEALRAAAKAAAAM